MTAYTLNEPPRHTQPRHAVLAEFTNPPDPDDLVNQLTESGINPSDVSILQGLDGLRAYQARGHWLSRVLDDTDAEIADTLRHGGLAVTIHHTTPQAAAAVSSQLRTLGATTTHHFRKYDYT